MKSIKKITDKPEKIFDQYPEGVFDQYPENPGEFDDQPKPVSLTELDPGHHPLVAEAIIKAGEWQQLRRSFSMASYILVASQVTDEWLARPGRKIPQDQWEDMKSKCTGKGVGKTHIALSIWWSSLYTAAFPTRPGQPVKQLPATPVNCFYMAADLIDRLHNKELISSLIPPHKTEFVIIDDVGMEKKLEFVSGPSQEHQMRILWFEIVNHCYKKKIGIVMTSNKSLPELRDYVGEQAWSRLIHMAPQGFIRDLTGVPDYRQILGGRA
jgi:hypothetical protein